MRIPDYCEAITAYRCWNVYPNGLMVGQGVRAPWPPYEAFAGLCHQAHPSHVNDRGEWTPAPVLACDCGIHALKSEADASQRLIDEIVQSRSGFSIATWNEYYQPANGRVWGAVKLWGRLIEHEIGYRAEFAYPYSLHCADAALAAAVSTLYGVPCDVQTLNIPEPKKDRYAEHYGCWYSSLKPMLYPSIVTVNPPARYRPQPGLIQSASLAQVATVKASEYQKAQAVIRGARRGGKSDDWQSVMRQMVYAAKKSDAASVIVLGGAE